VHCAELAAALYADLIAHKTPPEVARGYFIVNWLRERWDEERRGEGFR
jgi:hypothetical protein